MATLDAAHEGLVFGRLDMGAQVSDDPALHRPDRSARRQLRRAADRLARPCRSGVLPGDAGRPAGRRTPPDPAQQGRARPRCRGRPARRRGPEPRRRCRSSARARCWPSCPRARDRSMHSIVATIQAEQDRAIRAPNKGVVSISGGPGTGKTVVALHRAAYLLYADRRRYETGGVLVVGPVGGVHALHRARAAVPRRDRRRAAFARRGRRRRAATRRDEPAVAEVKGSAAMAEVLRRTARQAVPDAPARVPGLLPRRRDQPRPARARRAAPPAALDGAAQPLHHQGRLHPDRRDVAPGPQRARPRADQGGVRRGDAHRRRLPRVRRCVVAGSRRHHRARLAARPRPARAGERGRARRRVGAAALEVVGSRGRGRGALRRRRRPARRAALPDRRPADREHRLGRRRVPRRSRTPPCTRCSPPPTGSTPARVAGRRPPTASRTTGSRTCSSTRRRTSRRCSGGWSAVAVAAPPGRSSATSAQSSWPVPGRVGGRSRGGAGRQAAPRLPPLAPTTATPRRSTSSRPSTPSGWA